MSEQTTKKTTTRTTKPKAPKTPVVPEVAAELADKLEQIAEYVDVAENSEKIDLTDVSEDVEINDNTPIDVKSLRFGEVICTTQDGTTTWTKLGEVQTLSFRELREIKAKHIRFFEKQWIMPIGVNGASKCKAKPADVFEQLGITRYFKKFVDPTPNQILQWSPVEVAENAALLSAAARGNLAVGLQLYVKNKILTDLRVIDAWEKVLDCELIIRE